MFLVKVHDKETYLIDDTADRDVHVVVYSSATGHVPPQDTYLYRQHKEGAFTLKVTVVEANGLPWSDVTNTCNPYVKMRVTHAQDSQRTNAQQNTMTPRWHETYEFELIESADLAATELTLECWGQNLGGADRPIGKHSISLASVFASDDYEQWLKLDHVGDVDTLCGELLVRCQMDRQSPKLDELLHCYDQARATNLNIPAGERYLTLMAATSEPGLEGNFSFSVRSFDDSPCTIERVTPSRPPEEWECKNMRPDPSARKLQAGTTVCAVCHNPLDRARCRETDIGPCHHGDCYDSVAAVALPAGWRPAISRATGEFVNEETGEVSLEQPTPRQPHRMLSVAVVKATGLPDFAYAKMCVVRASGSLSAEQRTKTRREADWRTERFVFDLTDAADLVSSELRVELWQADRAVAGKGVPIGQCTLQMQNVVGDSVGSYERWLPLTDFGDATAVRGLEVLIRCELDFQPPVHLSGAGLSVRRAPQPTSPERLAVRLAVTHVDACSAVKPLRLKGGIGAEKQVEATKANIRAAGREELYRGARGVDLSRAGIDAELIHMGADPRVAAHAHRRDAKQRLILAGPSPVVSEEVAILTVLGKFDDDRVGALTSEQFHSCMVRFKGVRYKDERLLPLLPVDYARLFNYLDEDEDGEVTVPELCAFVHSGTLGTRLQQEEALSIEQQVQPGIRRVTPRKKIDGGGSGGGSSFWAAGNDPRDVTRLSSPAARMRPRTPVAAATAIRQVSSPAAARRVASLASGRRVSSPATGSRRRRPGSGPMLDGSMDGPMDVRRAPSPGAARTRSRTPVGASSGSVRRGRGRSPAARRVVSQVTVRQLAARRQEPRFYH